MIFKDIGRSILEKRLKIHQNEATELIHKEFEEKFKEHNIHRPQSLCLDTIEPPCSFHNLKNDAVAGFNKYESTLEYLISVHMYGRVF